MVKKLVIALVCFVCFLSGGCDFSKDDLLNEVIEIETENKKLKTDYDEYKNVNKLFDFYHKLTLQTVHSLVLVESKNVYTSYTKYSEGVVVYSSGYNYYILTDYMQLLRSSNVKYRVMDASANVYDASLISDGGSVLYDSQTGLALLKVHLSNASTNMQEISPGDKSDSMAIMSNVNQLNKIQLIDNTYINGEIPINYESQEYKVSTIEGISSGAIINDMGQLAGLYLYNLQGFASSNLIKKVAYATYSLIL